MMKEIIEQMMKQEIRGILAENEDTIREMVSTSLLPELRSAIRDSISRVFEVLIKEPPELAASQQVFKNTIPQESEEVQEPEFNSKTDLRPQTLPARHRERQSTAESTSGDCPTGSDEAGGPFVPGKTSPESNSNGRYLYCIVEGSESVNFGRIGIEGNEVYTIPFNDLCAVVHNCRAEPYQSEDEQVVKGWVVTHQKVVDAAWERFDTVLPMGFDTIIRGNAVAEPEENMRSWLKEDYENLKGKIEKVRDRAEYGVQIFWDSKVMAQKIVEESVEIKKLDKEVKTKPRGLAYLYRQRLEDLLKKEMERQADRYFKQFYERIRPYVDDLHVERNKKTKDENKQMLMNLSCLLPENGSQELGDELEKIGALEGFSVRYIGPWPPYSFV